MEDATLNMTLWEVLQTDVRAQIALAALIISLYALFRTSHKEKDHVEITLEKPIFISKFLYQGIVSGKKVKMEPIKEALHGIVLINNSSAHNIGYFGLEVFSDDKKLYLIEAEDEGEGMKVYSKTIGPTNYREITSGETYESGNINERSQYRIMFAATDIYTKEVPSSKNVYIKISFLKARYISSVPILGRMFSKTKTIKLKYKYKNVLNMTSSKDEQKRYKTKRL